MARSNKKSAAPMMQKFGDFIVKRRWWILVSWIVAAVLIVGLSPAISTIQSNDQSKFLPDKSESVQASKIAERVTGHSEAPTDVIIFQNKTHSALSDQELSTAAAAVKHLSDQQINRVDSVVSSPEQLSQNKQAQLATVTYKGNGDDTETLNAVKDVRANLDRQLKDTNLTAGVVGSEAIGFDTQDSANRALKIVSIGTILLVLILPMIIFKSPIAGIFPVLAIGTVFSIANGVISDAGHLFNFTVSQQLSILFTVVLFGIGTDYILFLLFRYRERLRSGDHTRGAVSFALGRAGAAISSAALVVLTSFAALSFAQFGIFSSLAPGLVICVVVMMLAALTLIPSLVAIIGEKIFWPSKAWMTHPEKHTISKRIGGQVARHPGSVTAVVSVVLIGLALFALNYRADFSSFAKPPKNTPSETAYADLNAAFPAGIINPTSVYITSTAPISENSLQNLNQQLAKAKGVAQVLPAQLTADKKTAIVSAVLTDDPYSNTAISNVRGPIHDAAHSIDSTTTKVQVGGITSIFADVQSVIDRDLKVLFPIAAAFIFVILAVLLRSLVAPIFLLICVSLGYVATLGATTLIFQTFAHEIGLISFLPIFLYIFVIAIGTDYNILTVTRLREEEREGNGPRKAADLTVEHSSATVASAGLILAATFSSLLLGNINFLNQLGASVALGVSLAAFVIAPFLIPSITALLGNIVWWPGHRPSEDNKK